MAQTKDLFKKDFGRNIETVIKADDQEHIYQEVDEYVITREISNKLANFFDTYTEKSTINGVWISGFFGSGKSHLLKILSYVLENRQYGDTSLGELFASKVTDDAKLKADITKCLRKIKSESILFNIDQHAQITTKSDANAILQVFYKVFYDHQGFYGFQPHIAEFEEYLSKEGNYEIFKAEFEAIYGKPWVDSRKDYVARAVNDAIAKACAKIYNEEASKYDRYLQQWQSKHKQSIEDFALKVSEYINSKEGNFRLNFFVDEVGQYIAENTKLMLNLQTIAESLNTKCNGNSWIIVTSQEDLESLVGDDSRIQSDDFSKIQGRFKSRIPLTSANVDEVIEKRLLEKNEFGRKTLKVQYEREGENLKTLLSFSEAGLQFKGFKNAEDYINKFPFIPYQFDLFQQCIKAMSRHNVFQGKHQSVGERSMLGVFQEVLKKSNFTQTNSFVSFDRMFEGIKSSLHSESQNLILLAENQLSDYPLAIRILKALFLVKYYESFKATARNISVLLLDSMSVNTSKHKEEIEIELNRLEQQTYIQRKGEIYEYLTDDEKDIETEIKNTIIDSTQVSQFINELVFDGIIRDNKIRFSLNKQEFEFTRKVDGILFGREKELKIDIITPNSDSYTQVSHYMGSTMGDPTLMMVKLAEDARFIYEARMYLKTIKYIKQTQSASNKESVRRILSEKGQQNGERKRLLENSLNELLAKSTIYLNGIENKSSASSDGKTRIIETAQELIQLAYPKLQLLGSANLDEYQLKLILAESQPALFGGTESSLSVPENEMLNLLKRRKAQDDRTSLSDLRDHFSKKPYGWTQIAIWCVMALLYKRGKIDARESSNVLDEKGFADALNNNRMWLNTLILPQIDFEQQHVTALKEIYFELFNESNPYTEAKEVAAQFKTKAKNEEGNIRMLLKEHNKYPFLKSLEPLADLLQKLSIMDYATLINSIKSYEDELLDTKEHIYDPILRFWNGEQKNIFDRILTFQSTNQANFDYIDSSKKQDLTTIIQDPTPYNGNLMKQAKEDMDVLQEMLLEKIKEERKLLLEEAETRLSQLQQSNNFLDAPQSLQETVQKPLNEIIQKAKTQNYIANLRVDRGLLSDVMVAQFNKLVPKTPTSPGAIPIPQVQFININNVSNQVRLDKSKLENSADVEEYIQALKNVMMDQINANKKITI